MASLSSLFVRRINSWSAALNRLQLARSLATRPSVPLSWCPTPGTMGHRRYSVAKPAIDVEAWLRDNGVTYSGNDTPAPLLNFHEGKWPDWIREAIQNQGFDKPTLIQSILWDVALKGRDMIGIGATGTGKILGFVLPCLVAAFNKPRKTGLLGPSSLILCPTGELAQQTFDTLATIASKSNLRAVCLFGKDPLEPQLRALDLGVDIIVATPGRLLRLMNMGGTRLYRVAYLVIDKADLMLEMDFKYEVTEIFKCCSKDKQTLMWSATWPKEVQQLAQQFLQNPVKITVGRLQEPTEGGQADFGDERTDQSGRSPRPPHWSRTGPGSGADRSDHVRPQHIRHSGSRDTDDRSPYQSQGRVHRRRSDRPSEWSPGGQADFGDERTDQSGRSPRPPHWSRTGPGSGADRSSRPRSMPKG